MPENKAKEGKTLDNQNNINDYFKLISSNSKRNRIYIESLKPIFKSKINYIYIYDIPIDLISYCSPNLFPHILKLNFDLKRYIIFRKKNKNGQLEIFIEESKKDFGFDKNDDINIIKEKFEKKNIIQDNRENEFNIFDGISFSSKENKEGEESNTQKNKIWKSDANYKKEDFKEIEYFLNRFNSPLINSMENENKKLDLKQDQFKYQQIEKLNSINNDNSINENKNKIILNKKNLFKKIVKKIVFKTQMDRTYFHSLFDKSIPEKSNIYNPNSSIKVPNGKKKHYNLRYVSTRNKQNKDKIKKIINKVNSSQKNKNLSIIAKTNSEIFRPQSFYNSYHKMLSNFDRNIKNQNKLVNLDSKSFKSPISQTKSMNNIKKKFEISVKDFNKRHIYMLNEFEKLYDETKMKGLLPKVKISYTFVHPKPFEGIYGFNIFDNINKNVTRQIEEIGEKTKVDYFFNRIKRNFKKIIKRNIFSKDNCSLKTIIKCPTLYSINK